MSYDPVIVLIIHALGIAAIYRLRGAMRPNEPTCHPIFTGPMRLDGASHGSV